MRRMIVGVLIVLLVAAVVSGIARYAYTVGVAQGVASVTTPSGKGAAPVPPYGAYPYPYGGPWPGPFWFGGFGLLWPILLIFLVFALLRAGRMGGAWGAGRGAPRWLEEWHRREHESGGSGGRA